jgi:uncharacterized protein (TIGR02246 family)
LTIPAGASFLRGSSKERSTMRTLIAALVLFSSSAALAAPKQSDEEAIKARVGEFIALFNKGDAKALTAYFADDATLVNPAGVKGTGSAEIEKVLSNDLATILKDTKMDMKVVQFRAVAKGAAWVELEHSVNGIKGPGGKTMNVTFHVPCLFVKKGKAWVVAEARPYAFLPPPPPSAATAAVKN